MWENAGEMAVGSEAGCIFPSLSFYFMNYSISCLRNLWVQLTLLSESVKLCNFLCCRSHAAPLPCGLDTCLGGKLHGCCKLNKLYFIFFASYHVRQFMHHAAQALDVAVVPRVHAAQVGTEGAEIPFGLMVVFLQKRNMKMDQKSLQTDSGEEIRHVCSGWMFFFPTTSCFRFTKGS